MCKLFICKAAHVQLYKYTKTSIHSPVIDICLFLAFYYEQYCYYKQYFSYILV